MVADTIKCVFGCSSCDPLKLHCDPLGYQQPSLHTKFYDLNREAVSFL